MKLMITPVKDPMFGGGRRGKTEPQTANIPTCAKIMLPAAGVVGPGNMVSGPSLHPMEKNIAGSTLTGGAIKPMHSL